MELRSDRELANTREKLRMLEEEYKATRNDRSEKAAVRAVALRSLKRLINQLHEEIARYEAHQAVRR
jgi:flagellar biosynthesis chaperone FliJ